MKKLVSLILVLALVLACSVAMAEEPTRLASSKDLEDVPEFVEPLPMKTKRSGSNVKVTIEGEVDSIEVLWYGVGEEFEELELVDGAATYVADGHRYQPGVYGTKMNLTRGTETLGDILVNLLVDGLPYTETLGQQINDANIVIDGKVARAYNGVIPNVDITSTDDSSLIDNSYETDALWLFLETTDPETGLILAEEVTDYKTARAIVKKVMTSDDQYNMVQEGDWRISDDTISDDGTAQTRAAGKRVYYWTLEKVKDWNGDTAFKVIQPWGVKVDGAAYKVVAGDVTFYYDRAGKFLAEEIEVADADPFQTGEAGTAVYTYSKMVAKSNEKYYLSKVSCEFEEGDYSLIYQSFSPNAAKSGYALHCVGN